MLCSSFDLSYFYLWKKKKIMELLRFRFYAWLFELTSFQDIPVFLCQILLNALVCCSILSIDSTFLLALVNIMQKIDKMYAAFTGQPLEKVQQYTERDRFLSVSEVIFLSPLFFFNLFIFLLSFFKEWEWKMNTKHLQVVLMKIAF